MSADEDFARAFGDALKAHLDKMEIDYAKAAPRLGVTKQALSTYWTDDSKGKRRKPRAELLYRACIEFDFEFEYAGKRVTLAGLGSHAESSTQTAEQLRFEFSRQFNLTEDKGLVSVSLERQPGRIELSVSLKAAS